MRSNDALIQSTIDVRARKDMVFRSTIHVREMKDKVQGCTAYVLFCRDYMNQHRRYGKVSSNVLTSAWKNLPDDLKDEWREMAKGISSCAPKFSGFRLFEMYNRGNVSDFMWNHFTEEHRNQWRMKAVEMNARVNEVTLEEISSFGRKMEIEHSRMYWDIQTLLSG